MPQQRVGLWISSLAIVAIAIATLLPRTDTAGLAVFWCVLCGDFGPVDFLLNVLLFVPLGIGLAVSGVSRRRAVMICVVGTALIELLQWRVIAGRDSSIGDIFANVSGAWLGATLVLSWRSLAYPGVATARLRGVTAVGGWVALLLLTAWAMRPAPTRETYFSQRAPRLAHLAIFHGRLLEAKIAGVDVPSGPLLAREAFANRMRSGLTVSARIIPADTTPGPAPIVSVFDQRRREILLLGQEGADAIFRVRLASRTLGLRAPGVRLRHGVPSPKAGSGDARSIWMFGYTDGQQLTVAAGQKPALTASRLPLSPGLGWTLFLPTDVALDYGAQWISALWLAVLMAPAAYWLSLGAGAGRAARRWTAMALASAIAIALAAVPLLFDTSAAVVAEWIGTTMGASGGWLLGLTIREAAARHDVTRVRGAM